MQICKQHWDQLKLLIEEAGLSSFISEDGREAMSRTMSELKNEPSKPDPLMMCNNMIWSRSIETFGLGILQKACPLCYANRNYPDKEGEPTGDYWVRTLVPHIKQLFSERGLLNQN